MDTTLENEFRPEYEDPVDYSLEKLFFLKETYKEVNYTTKLFSDKFLKFMMN